MKSVWHVSKMQSLQFSNQQKLAATPCLLQSSAAQASKPCENEQKLRNKGMLAQNPWCERSLACWFAESVFVLAVEEARAVDPWSEMMASLSSTL